MYINKWDIIISMLYMICKFVCADVKYLIYMFTISIFTPYQIYPVSTTVNKILLLSLLLLQIVSGIWFTSMQQRLNILTSP